MDSIVRAIPDNDVPLAPEAPHVGGGGAVRAPDHLGRHELQGPVHPAPLLLWPPELLRQAKVNNSGNFEMTKITNS